MQLADELRLLNNTRMFVSVISVAQLVQTLPNWVAGEPRAETLVPVFSNLLLSKGSDIPDSLQILLLSEFRRIALLSLDWAPGPTPIEGWFAIAVGD